MTAAEFLALHRAGDPLLLPNAYDVGSALILQGLGFRAVATTSSGFAATLGRADGQVSAEESLDHAGALAEALDIPLSADLENGFHDDPARVAEVVAAAIERGLAGCSVEDVTQGRRYESDLAVERVRTAADAAGSDLVLTARCENHLYGHGDLADTIARLQAFSAAGADVLYAPGLTDLADIRTLVAEVDRPVNVLVLRGGPTPAELAEAGVARISVGGAFAWSALSGLVGAAEDLLAGRLDFLEHGAPGRAAVAEHLEG